MERKNLMNFENFRNHLNENEEKEEKFFNSKDKYSLKLKCEHEKIDKRDRGPVRRYEVNETGLTLGKLVSILKKNEKPGTLTKAGISVKNYVITNESTGKKYSHHEHSEEGLYDKGLSNLTVSYLKSINERLGINRALIENEEETLEVDNLEETEEEPKEDKKKDKKKKDKKEDKKSDGEIASDVMEDVMEDIEKKFSSDATLTFTSKEITLNVPGEEESYSSTQKLDDDKDMEKIVKEMIKDIESQMEEEPSKEPEEGGPSTGDDIDLSKFLDEE